MTTEQTLPITAMLEDLKIELGEKREALIKQGEKDEAMYINGGIHMIFKIIQNVQKMEEKQNYKIDLLRKYQKHYNKAEKKERQRIVGILEEMKSDINNIPVIFQEGYSRFHKESITRITN